jgi:hypothetical protein
MPGGGRVEARERLVDVSRRGSWISAPESVTFCFIPHENSSQGAVT